MKHLNSDDRSWIFQGQEVAIKSQGEIESAISEGVSRFEREYAGRSPKDIRVYLNDDFVVVRLIGNLSKAEKNLVKAISDEKGRELLKYQRAEIIEAARSALEAMIEEATGTKVLSLHHDISTITGEEVVLFTLAESPVKT